MHSEKFFQRSLLLCLATLLCSFSIFGQTDSSKPEPDVLVFKNGEKLIGHLERAVGSSVVFKSDMAGEVTVGWDKIQELRTHDQFAVIGKGVQSGKKLAQSDVPQGQIAFEDQKLEVTPNQGTPKSIPASDAAYVVDQATYQKDILTRKSFFQDWRGAATAGASLVEATQNSRSFTGALSLVRAEPGVGWLDPRNRTIIDFAASYGKVSQPRTPTIKTEIIHAGVERDEYLTSKLYAFGSAAWDHDYSQGLDLQQTYGGGLGWTVFKTDASELDFKASVDYIKQQFADPANNQNLIGSKFGEDYNRKFAHGVVFIESLAVTPAWNNLNAYSALGSASLGLPIYKKLNITLGATDSFLNNPPPGFKKNAFQFIAGLTYSIQ